MQVAEQSTGLLLNQFSFLPQINWDNIQYIHNLSVGIFYILQHLPCRPRVSQATIYSFDFTQRLFTKVKTLIHSYLFAPSRSKMSKFDASSCWNYIGFNSCHAFVTVMIFSQPKGE